MKTLTATLALIAAPVLAQAGDADAGKAAFDRQCVACHVVVDGAGTKLAGRNARTGPNLFGIADNVIGNVDGFRYSKPIKALNEQGAVWDEAAFTAYVQDPTGWLRETLSDSKARGRMAFKVRSADDAANLFAYLQSVAN